MGGVSLKGELGLKVSLRLLPENNLFMGLTLAGEKGNVKHY